MALTIQRLAELAPPQVRALFGKQCDPQSNLQHVHFLLFAILVTSRANVTLII